MSLPFVVIIGGIQGAGKDTQRVCLQYLFDCPGISTGDMFRLIGGHGEDEKERREGERLRRMIHAHLDPHEANAWIEAITAATADPNSPRIGDLVSDTIVISLLAWRTAEPDCQHGYLLSAGVRTKPQAIAFDKLCKERGLDLSRVVYGHLTVPDDVAAEQIARRARAQTPPRPDDARPDAIARRIARYYENLAPLREHYSADDRWLDIPGTGPIEVVARRFYDELANRGITQPVAPRVTARPRAPQVLPGPLRSPVGAY